MFDAADLSSRFQIEQTCLKLLKIAQNCSKLLKIDPIFIKLARKCLMMLTFLLDFKVGGPFVQVFGKDDSVPEF
jgi:hypothetical protein